MMKIHLPFDIESASRSVDTKPSRNLALFIIFQRYQGWRWTGTFT